MKAFAFTPLAEMTPQKAHDDFVKAAYFLRQFEGVKTLGFLEIAKRLMRLQRHRLLEDHDVPAKLWEIAEGAGLIDEHGVDSLQTMLDAAAQSVEENPDTDPHKIGALSATPFVWTDPTTIPQRDRLYGNLLVRKFLTATIAPGGVGKSSLAVVETLAQISHRDLLGTTSKNALRVWLWNLEDPQEETLRKIMAAAERYRLTPEDIGDRLFVDSGREQKLVLATATRNGATIAKPVSDALIAECREREIDVLVVDPFVSSHEVPENDNGAMDMVAKEWARIADQANCAVHLIHHTRKGSDEVTTESARGAKSFTDACRVVRVVNRMTKDEGSDAGVENHRLYFRTLNDKASLAPPVDKSDWFKLDSVQLNNGVFGMPGDSVGVVTPWKWPDPLDGITGKDFDKVAAVIRKGQYRQDVQANNWVGNAVAEALGLSVHNPADKAKIKGMVRMWLVAGSLRVVERDDDRRRPKKFIELAESDDETDFAQPRTSMNGRSAPPLHP